MVADSVADSVVYEPSREEMPVSEGPGLDYTVNSGPEMPFSGFVDRLNMPGGSFAGVGPVEPSPVLPHTSDLVGWGGCFRVKPAYPGVQVAIRTV